MKYDEMVVVSKVFFVVCFFVFTPKLGGNDPFFDEHIFQVEATN